MIISLLAALDEKNGIGRDGGMPWHLTDDLKHFRRLTRGHHVLMGRKTYQTVAGKLPGRSMLVLSRDASFQPVDAQVFGDFDAALAAARAVGEQEIFVIGGAQIFALALPLAQRFHLTRVHTDASCDVFFPHFAMGDWQVLSQREFAAGGNNEHAFTIYEMARRQ